MTEAPTPHAPLDCDVAIVGGGPAGLMAAQRLAQAGVRVHLFDAMPSVGRKFLLAGKGGLNLTHSEPDDAFAARFGARRAQIEPMLQVFGAAQVKEWAAGLGIETFVGTSGRVFPVGMKAAPLLRAWLVQLRSLGVQFHTRHRWLGWKTEGEGEGALRFATPAGELLVRARALVLALGGASWPQLGSDGAWAPWLEARGVHVAPLQPANCGFDVLNVASGTAETRRTFLRELVGLEAAPARGWTPHFQERFAGQPLKSVGLSFTDSQGHAFARRGEFVITATGIEGSLVYAASQWLRNEIGGHGHATLHLDLLPEHGAERVAAEVCHPRGARSLSSHLKSRLGIDGVKMGLLHEVLGREGVNDPAALAQAIKALPLTLAAARPVAEAISTAGGVAFEALDANGMLQAIPGVFCAGEMLDWEAPTGGYLLTACLASGVYTAEGVQKFLAA
ncbi:TIGR03862 family flavoprotein [Comamonas endophytica]|uniref:TIGR03862 family flavoprotein n=1 Tax=Comamonas endophytica TaxID=2949090 RepID=A0ABY6GAQ3_9BURK|nr:MULTISPECIES: TIGR03862 family flavoprotein [unclassified Acidovorax]MCD2513843.1 TIGR03862 family flavoprotein [Acidovorax sp. D4N7]UYG52156.1 TIGR03862 family flavoprotein [Acidovorax sp. 5MLIR]